MPKLSVLIPSYNNGRFLSELIGSILTQNFTDFELVICDDCSSDDSVRIIKTFSDARIKFFQNDKNLGIVGNMNRCLGLAQGEYIFMIGSDDLMCPENLKKKVAFLDANPDVGLVCSNINMINEEGKSAGQIWSSLPDKETIFTSEETFKRLMFEGNFICHPSVMLRKKLHDEFGLYDSRFPSCQDYEMWSRLSLHTKLGYIPEALIGYRWHSNNITQQYRGEKAYRGKSQNALTKLVALRHYHAHNEKFLSKQEIKELYDSIAFSFFWINEFKYAREAFLASFKYTNIQFKNLLYYIFSFFPPMWISYLRHLKREAIVS
jgi:glycosyltransferase involved in cell wall biosynthesis